MKRVSIFGVWFLIQIGYFDCANRFWKERDFPEAHRVRARIAGFIRLTLRDDFIAPRFRSKT